MDEAYAVQAAVQACWGRPVGGVKVGRVLGEWAERFSVDRFVGPICAETIQHPAPGQTARFPVIAGGTALLECEVIAVLGRDADDAITPEARAIWSPACISASRSPEARWPTSMRWGRWPRLPALATTTAPSWGRRLPRGRHATSARWDAWRVSTDRTWGAATPPACPAASGPHWLCLGRQQALGTPLKAATSFAPGR
jgi:hypothetical protein